MGNGYSRIPALWEQGVLRSTTRKAASAVGSLMESREEVLLEQAASGEGVILGRGSVIVLREHPGVLRVRLDGPPQRRLQQAMRLEGLDEGSAERALR